MSPSQVGKFPQTSILLGRASPVAHLIVQLPSTVKLSLPLVFVVSYHTLGLYLLDSELFITTHLHHIRSGQAAYQRMDRRTYVQIVNQDRVAI